MLLLSEVEYQSTLTFRTIKHKNIILINLKRAFIATNLTLNLFKGDVKFVENGH